MPSVEILMATKSLLVGYELSWAYQNSSLGWWVPSKLMPLKIARAIEPAPDSEWKVKRPVPYTGAMAGLSPVSDSTSQVAVPITCFISISAGDKLKSVS
ncbi:MAG: hypothetical protein BWY27_00018 [Bacteroidetes bacterium ADurb.Bin234]|nr:MAG: hypothetical protein BWY27_00018 [Bacteroidetes bacterium ADurb.Bin234]